MNIALIFSIIEDAIVKVIMPILIFFLIFYRMSELLSRNAMWMYIAKTTMICVVVFAIYYFTMLIIGLWR